MARRVAVITILSLLSACAFDDVGAAESDLVITDRCEVSGLGLLGPDAEFFVGRVRGDGVSVTGSWAHLGPSVVLGEADFIDCRINGALVGDVGGPATLDGVGGYNYRVSVRDFGDPGPPDVIEGLPEVQTVTATRRYRPTRWEDGRVAIDERALVTIPAELPVTVGNAGNQWAWLTFQRSESRGVVRCRYRGGARTPNPRTPADLAAGQAYYFERCTCERGDDVEPGDRVDVRWMELHVQTGAHFLPSSHAAQTTVSVDLDVTPLVLRERQRDRYGIGVWDDVTGERVYFRDGELISGNIQVLQLD